MGTAVYQVGFASSKLEKKERALKPDEHQIEAPTDNEAETAAISPWMWKRGITFKHLSAEDRDKDWAIFDADAAIFDCNKGTILGLEVVPDVWRIKATSFSHTSSSSMKSLSPSPTKENNPAT